jgi:hypothetical protein
MSNEVSVYISAQNRNNPTAACLQAVNDCDFFLGIIFTRYGSGITHKEFQEAVRIDKPRLFLADEKIEFIRKLLQSYIYDEQKNRTEYEIPKNSVLDSIKVVDMYLDARPNWVQSFANQGEVLFFIKQQFQDYKKRLKELGL